MNIETVRAFARRPMVVRTLVYSIGFGVGYLTGSKITQKKAHEEVEARIAEEVDRAHTFYKRLYKKEEYADPTTLDEQIDGAVTVVEEPPPVASAMKSYHKLAQGYVEVTEEGSATRDDMEEAKDVVRNVFKDHVTEVRTDNPGVDLPDIQEVDEDDFMSGDHGYDEQVLLFFLEDGVLTDSERQYITDPVNFLNQEIMFKLDNMPEGLTDLHVLHHVKQIAYLITTIDDSYGETHMQHSQIRKPRRKTPRFRRDDE